MQWDQTTPVNRQTQLKHYLSMNYLWRGWGLTVLWSRCNNVGWTRNLQLITTQVTKSQIPLRKFGEFCLLWGDHKILYNHGIQEILFSIINKQPIPCTYWDYCLRQDILLLQPKALLIIVMNLGSFLGPFTLNAQCQSLCQLSLPPVLGEALDVFRNLRNSVRVIYH